MTPHTINRFAAALTVAAGLCVATPSTAPCDEPAGNWVSLFNGQNLEGWTPKFKGHELGVNLNDTFRVEDGVLKVAYDKWDRFNGEFGHLFYKSPYSKYRLRIEYRFVGDQVSGGPGWAVRNSGAMLHCEDPAGMQKDQEFPVSVEAQFLGGDGSHDRTTGNVCTPGTNIVMNGELVTRHCNSSRSKTYHGDQWVTAEFVVDGSGTIRHLINDETVLEYEQPQLDPSDEHGRRLLEAGSDKLIDHGYISLQAESHPVEFRKVEILDESDAAADAPLVNLLAGKLDEHWATTGNWKLGDDGVVKLTPRPGESGWQRYGAYLWSNETYDDFEIDFEYRVEKSGNSGFYFNVGDVDDPVAQGIEVQIYDAPASAEKKLTDHDSGGVIPGVPPTKAAAKPAGRWNRFQVKVVGETLTIRLNGETVNEIALDEHPRLKDRPKSGAIGFQDHGMPLELRNINIRRLPASTKTAP